MTNSKELLEELQAELAQATTEVGAMRCDRCGKATNTLFHAGEYELCPKCAKLLFVLLESKQLVGSLAIASMPLGERARLHRERAEEYARGEVA